MECEVGRGRGEASARVAEGSRVVVGGWWEESGGGGGVVNLVVLVVKMRLDILRQPRDRRHRHLAEQRQRRPSHLWLCVADHRTQPIVGHEGCHHRMVLGLEL